MKGLLLFTLAGLMTLSGCYIEEGPRGPRGYDGRDGIDGVDGEESYVFEYEFSFTAPDYSQLLLFPDHFQMLSSDMVLVYFLWEVTDDGVEIWRALPQKFYFDSGELVLNFDFTKYDVSVFMDGTVNLDELGAAYTDNWIARVVVVPGQFGGRGDLDVSDYEAVKNYLNLSESKLARAGYAKRP